MSILRHVSVALVLCAISAALGCGDFDVTINLSGSSGATTGAGGGGTGGSGGDGGGCVATFDPQTGAEDDACTIVEDPACEKGFCGDDGMCSKIPFPAGTKCAEGKVCDGSGHCEDAPTCDASACDDGNECTHDYCAPDDGDCFSSPYPRTHLCGDTGHCDPDTKSCCNGVFVLTGAGIDAGFPAYECWPSCPLGQAPDPQTAVCK